MILHLIKCETCDATHQFEPMMGHVLSQIPRDWLSLYSGDRSEEGYLFCSYDCLKKHLGVGESAQQEPQLQLPISKARRFMLVDGETADEFEGVRFNSGHVSIDTDLTPTHYATHYSSWEAFKVNNPGSGITWIDQEASADVN